MMSLVLIKDEQCICNINHSINNIQFIPGKQDIFTMKYIYSLEIQLEHHKQVKNITTGKELERNWKGKENKLERIWI